MEHGRDGWELADYDWCPETGVATLTYEHPKRREQFVEKRAQPAEPKHAGWYTGALKI